MKTRKWLVHAIFECEDCGKRWEDYNTSQKKAWAHANRTRHTVRGEAAYCVVYKGKE
jgi:hypothetical protein